MKFNYEILTTPTADTPGSTVLLHFPDRRYFFGQLSEGTQRACTESGTKITNVTDVFLSGRMEWSNTGGLIGVILTLADGLASSTNALETAAREKEANREQNAGKNTSAKQKTRHKKLRATENNQGAPQQRALTIHGGRNLAHTLATARRFVFRKGMPVYTKEYDPEAMATKKTIGLDDPCEQPTFSDSNIKVWAMPITSSPAPQSRPQSPRKRSLDEFQETASVPELNPKLQDQLMRQSVVADMFNSSWTLDALVETRLAEVKMPAIMFVRNPETKDLERYTGPTPGSDQPLPDITVLVRKPWPGATVEKIPTTSKSNDALSYIIRNHDIRGGFLTKMALELGVKPGPDFGLLTSGKSVISQHGTEVTPDMVLGPTRLGKGMAIIDLPTRDYVENLVNRPEWRSAAATTELKAFIWILGPGVGDHPLLQQFVTKWAHCEHIVSSADYCSNYLSMKSMAGSSIRMAKLRPDNFPIPFHDNSLPPQTRDKSHPFTLAEPGLVVDMAPEFGINRSGVIPRLQTSRIITQIPVAAQRRASIISNRLQKAQPMRKLRTFLKNLPGANAEIFTLGTGSSSPSKYRNVSSTLIHVPDQGYYLLDCGENTLGQLKRVFEPTKLREVLQNLRLIWISHLHADHHLGTATVIKAWFQENYPDGIPQSESDTVEMDMAKILQQKRLFLVSEPMMIEWLEEYASVEDFGFGKLVPLVASPRLEDGSIKTRLLYRHCRADGTYPGRDLDAEEPATTELSFIDTKSPLTPLLQQATGLSDLLTTRVSHCRNAMAVSLVFPDGFKASFSGDCRPSDMFATIGKGSTILIHEATFQDDMLGSAVAKKHSTVSEAIEVGRKMHARSILLTHFSQRYQKVAYVDQEDAPKSQGKAIAQPLNMQGATDIPVDEGEEAHSTDISMVLDPDAQETKNPPSVVPIVTAFDYMRVRVGDMFTMEAYTPAIEKLHKILERAAEQEAEKFKQQREAEEERKQALKKAKREAHETKKPAKKEAKNEAKDGANGVPEKRNNKANKTPPGTPGRSRSRSPRSSSAGNRMPLPPPPQPPKHVSIWSASESESGWTDSDGEGDIKTEGNRDRRGRSPRRSRSRSRSREKQEKL